MIDGPNIVERLFGIDARLKNGWGVLAGAYAGSKLASGTVKTAAKGADFMTGGKLSDAKNQIGNRNRKGTSNTRATSPNASSKVGLQENEKNITDAKDTSKQATPDNLKNVTDETADLSGSSASKSISSQQDEEQPSGHRKQPKAPSPIDMDSSPSKHTKTRSNKGEQMNSQLNSANLSDITEQGKDAGTLSNLVSTGGSNNDNSQSSAIETSTGSFYTDSPVQDNHSINTQTGTKQQSADHIGQITDHTAPQTTHRTATAQATVQRATASTVKRRPSAYQIPTTASIEKLKPKNCQGSFF